MALTAKFLWKNNRVAQRPDVFYKTRFACAPEGAAAVSDTEAISNSRRSLFRHGGDRKFLWRGLRVSKNRPAFPVFLKMIFSEAFYPRFVFWAALLAAGLFAGPAGVVHALEVRKHPVYDLIEGDERMPPQGEHLVEERPATPAYPLPSASKFSHALPVSKETGEAKNETSTTLSDDMKEWEDWARWDNGSEINDWSDWEEDPQAEKASGDLMSDEAVSESTDRFEDWNDFSAAEETVPSDPQASAAAGEDASSFPAAPVKPPEAAARRPL